MDPAYLIIAASIGLVLVAIIAVEQRRIKAYARAYVEKDAALGRTSKVLIEKNLELSDQNVRLQKLLEAKTDFVGIASHQLRTPTTELSWGIEGLVDGSFGPLTDEQMAHLKKIRDSIRRMAGLIDDLLRLVRIESGYKEYNLVRQNLNALLTKLAPEIALRFKEKHIAFNCQTGTGETLVLVDVEMIGIVFTNLLENAFHYTPPNGTITVTTLIKDGKFQCEITDTGIGISREKQEMIFKKFQRTDGAAKMNASGTGLGLYIAQNIIHQHRGEIWFSSQEGKGSTFAFALPLEASE